MGQRIGYLTDVPCGAVESSATDPASVRDEARLYRQCLESCLDRKAKYERGRDTICEDLEYIEIVAGKIVHDFPGAGAARML